jgi:hypothetical protein
MWLSFGLILTILLDVALSTSKLPTVAVVISSSNHFFNLIFYSPNNLSKSSLSLSKELANAQYSSHITIISSANVVFVN